MGRGEEGQLCDPGSELLLGGSARVVEDDKWDEKKQKCHRVTPTHQKVLRLDVAVHDVLKVQEAQPLHDLSFFIGMR